MVGLHNHKINKFLTDMGQKSKKHIFIIFFSIIIIALSTILFISRYDKLSDLEAYEEVIATMSMEKANHFFNNHKNSKYKDILVEEIIEWCNEEKTEKCYKIILDTIPKDHIRYLELSTYYEIHFKDKGEKE